MIDKIVTKKTKKQEKIVSGVFAEQFAGVGETGKTGLVDGQQQLGLGRCELGWLKREVIVKVAGVLR